MTFVGNRPSGLQSCQVRHVQTDIDREGLYRYRREMVEDVENRGQRIQQARGRSGIQTDDHCRL